METITTVQSEFGPHETMDRLEAMVRARGMTVFARIDHGAGAAQAGLALRPTILLIFGSPKVGTILMQANQAIGLDLPIRVLVWQGEDGTTRISSINLTEFAKRYAIVDLNFDHIVQTVTSSLQALMHAASGGV